MNVPPSLKRWLSVKSAGGKGNKMPGSIPFVESTKYLASDILILYLPGVIVIEDQLRRYQTCKGNSLFSPD